MIFEDAHVDIDWGGDTSRHYTKPQKIIQSPESLYRDIKYYTKTWHIKQEQQQILRTDSCYYLTYDIQYIRFKTTHMNQQIYCFE